MAKRKRKQPQKEVTLPVHGNVGPDAPAQRRHAIITVRTERNGTRTQSKFTTCIIDRLRNQTDKNGDAMYSKRQMLAGELYFAAYSKTLQTGEASFARPYVQSSPDYDAQSIRRAEARAEYGRLRDTIPMAFRPIIRFVIEMENDIPNTPAAGSYHAQLQVALDLLANEMRL